MKTGKSEKRILIWILVMLCMVVLMVPAMVFADEEGDAAEAPVKQTATAANHSSSSASATSHSTSSAPKASNDTATKSSEASAASNDSAPKASETPAVSSDPAPGNSGGTEESEPVVDPAEGEGSVEAEDPGESEDPEEELCPIEMAEDEEAGEQETQGETAATVTPAKKPAKKPMAAAKKNGKASRTQTAAAPWRSAEIIYDDNASGAALNYYAEGLREFMDTRLPALQESAEKQTNMTILILILLACAGVYIYSVRRRYPFPTIERAEGIPACIDGGHRGM